MKKVMNTILVIFGAVFIGICLIYITSDVHIKTSTSGILGSSYQTTRYNSIFKMKFPDYFFDDSNEEDWDSSLEDALAKVTDADPLAYTGPYSSASELVFPIDNYIYYYRENDFEHFYRLDTETGNIESLRFSKFALHGEYSTDKAENQGMHNFTVATPITAEALISYFDMAGAIDSVDGLLYEDEIYFFGGRVFFEKNNKLYEYLPKSDSVKLVGILGRGMNIEFLYV